MHQLKRIIGNTRHNTHFANISPKTELLDDVYDGDIYRAFYEENRNSIKTGNVFSYTLNTDGISVCEKSTLSITPIILAINELPLAERFCIENVAIAGMYFFSF